MKWIINEAPANEFKCVAKFRYRQKDIPVTVKLLDNNEIKITYGEPTKAVTPGQVAVLYDGDICLGGGIIKSIEPLEEKYRYLNM